jgi:phosphotransferase system HPr (HPr) family protein
MYRFQSILEMPLKVESKWYTVMVGITPTEDFIDTTPEKLNFFIMNREPKKGIYIEGVSIQQVKNFLNTTKNNLNIISNLYSKNKDKPLQKRILSIEEIIDQENIELKNNQLDLKLSPSFEVFIKPSYVSSPDEYIIKKTKKRLEQFTNLYTLLCNNNLNEPDLYKMWSDKNETLNKIAHPIRNISDKNYFSPIQYCNEGKHYWEWLEIGKANKLKVFVRQAYIVNEDSEDNKIIAKENGLDEYKNIPHLSCPYHNPFQQEENDTHITRIIPVNNKLGIHTRPSIEITYFATKYEGDIEIESSRFRGNAKDTMDNLQLYALKGSNIKIKIQKTSNREKLEEVFRGIYHAANHEIHST